MPAKDKMVNIPVETFIEILKNLDESAKDEIFYRVYMEADDTPLDKAEMMAIERAELELKNGETYSWPFGE